MVTEEQNAAKWSEGVRNGVTSDGRIKRKNVSSRFHMKNQLTFSSRRRHTSHSSERAGVVSMFQCLPWAASVPAIEFRLFGIVLGTHLRMVSKGLLA